MLQPDDAVSQQQKIYDKYKNLAPADVSRRKAEDSAQIDSVATSTYDAIQGNKQPTEIAQGLAKFATKTADATVGQNARTDATNLQQSQLKESITGQRQATALTNRATDIANKDQQLKRNVANRAFEMGITGKELSLHADATLADIGFEKTAEDYQAGRITAEELKQISFQQAKKAQQLQLENQKLLLVLKQETAKDIAEGNIERAKVRTKEYYARLKAQAQESARAANNAAIVSGVFMVGGAALGAIGGPAGAVVGSQVGAGLAPAANAAIN